MPCFSQFGGNHQAAQWSKSGESQPLQGSFANIWELKMPVGAEEWCLLRDHHAEMYSTLLLVQLLEAEDVPALL